MTPGQLVKAVSTALDVPEETVTQHDRNLVVAGLRTKGGRGRSAPEVTHLDAARLLVATLGSIRAKDSVETVQEFERAIFVPRRSDRAAELMGEPDIALKRLPENHNVLEGLAAVISEASQPIGDLEKFLDRFSDLGVSISSLRHAAIGGLRGLADYHVTYARQPALTEEQQKQMAYCRQGIHQDRRVFGTAIMLIGAAFRDNGLRFADAGEAYQAGYGTKTPKSKKAKAA